MNEVIHKQIQYDTFTVDIIEKDSKTYLHFQGYLDIPFLDKSIKESFCRPVKNTGEDIEKEFKEFLVKNGIPVDETKYFDINYFDDEIEKRREEMESEIEEGVKSTLKSIFKKIVNYEEFKKNEQI